MALILFDLKHSRTAVGSIDAYSLMMPLAKRCLVPKLSIEAQLGILGIYHKILQVNHEVQPTHSFEVTTQIKIISASA